MFSSTYVSTPVSQMASQRILQHVQDGKIDPSVIKDLLGLINSISENSYENGIHSVSDECKNHDDLSDSKEECCDQKSHSDPCSICMEPLHTNTVKTHCGHTYHVDCLKKWNEVNTTCPLCRQDLGHMEGPLVHQENPPSLELPSEYLYRHMDDAVLHELRRAVETKLDRIRLELPHGTTFQCPCGSSIRRSSTLQHFRSQVHYEWMMGATEEELRYFLF